MSRHGDTIGCTCSSQPAPEPSRNVACTAPASQPCLPQPPPSRPGVPPFQPQPCKPPPPAGNEAGVILGRPNPGRFQANPLSGMPVLDVGDMYNGAVEASGLSAPTGKRWCGVEAAALQGVPCPTFSWSGHLGRNMAPSVPGWGWLVAQQDPWPRHPWPPSAAGWAPLSCTAPTALAWP